MSTSTLVLFNDRERKPDVEFANVKQGLVALHLSPIGSFLRVNKPVELQASIFKKTSNGVEIMGVESEPELSLALLRGVDGFESLRLSDHVTMDRCGVYKQVQKFLKEIDSAIRTKLDTGN